jgi:hypothetical protein
LNSSVAPKETPTLDSERRVTQRWEKIGEAVGAVRRAKVKRVQRLTRGPLTLDAADRHHEVQLSGFRNTDRTVADIDADSMIVHAPCESPRELRVPVFSGGAPRGEETLPIVPLGDRTYRLLASPGLVEGLAAAAEFELDASATGGIRVLRRGGNLCIWFYGAVASAFDEAVQRHPGSTWLYGNVYDPSDGVTPLNWW